mmetsp:Transcript_120606/g.240153  ORF Transcript_120606/g.240153 Transcript_120606/m.240153 type:complete len:137 (-) Transcript_120606:197-607(-)
MRVHVDGITARHKSLDEVVHRRSASVHAARAQRARSSSQNFRQRPPPGAISGKPPLGGALGHCAHSLRAASAQLKQLQQAREERRQQHPFSFAAAFDGWVSSSDSSSQTESREFTQSRIESVPDDSESDVVTVVSL